MNDTIHDWQEKMMIPTRGSSIGDFQRNFLIDGIKGYSEEPKEHIQQRLSTLIAKASAYPHDDNNTAEEALLKWMTANTGAQDNVNVATLLFTNEEFSQTPLLLFDTETQYANWSIQDGRVALQFALEIPTLIDPNNGMYHIKLSNGTEIQFNDLTEKIVGADTYQSLKKNDRLQPVATVRGTIALEYNAQAKNKITPVVSALQVSSQTSVLNEPNQQLSRRFKL